jgi:tetratricopeptide (TPR) repeat protein
VSPMQQRPNFGCVAALAVALLISSLVAAAPNTPDRSTRAAQLRAKAFEYAYNLDHDRAVSILQEAAAADPNDPAVYHSLASITWLNILFRRGSVTTDEYLGKLVAKDVKVSPPPAKLAKAFKRYVERAAALAQRRLDRHPGDVQAQYDLGVALGLQASYTATIEGRVLGAFGPARRAFNAHERVLAVDASRHDAGLIVGTYRYVVAGLALPMRWMAYLAGFGGDKERALALIEAAARTESEVQTEAKFALVLLYNREKEYEKAQRVLTALKRRYPRNRLLWLESGSAALRAGSARRAVQELDEGLAMLAKDTRPRMFGEEPLWRYKRGVALRALGRFANARTDLQFARAHETKPWIKGRALLELGMVADLDRQRDQAVARYEAASAVCQAAGDRICADEANRLRQTPFRNRTSLEIVSSR